MRALSGVGVLKIWLEIPNTDGEMVSGTRVGVGGRVAVGAMGELVTDDVACPGVSF